MKNALIVVLLVVLAALGFLYYKKSVAFVGKSGAKHQRHDHNGKPVDTEECERLVGKNNDICIIPISYLQSMVTGGHPDTAMEVHHKETIIWYGDNGESIAVQQMNGIDCSKHDQQDNPPPGSGPFLVGITQVTPSLTYAQITDNPKNDNYCYKTNITVTVNGRTTTIDPHDFGTP